MLDKIKLDKIVQASQFMRIGSGRDAWLGEGGNPRTGQKSRIDEASRVERTRHIMGLHEQEQQARDLATYAPDAGADRLNPQAQLGRPININQFISRLRRLNPSLIFEPSVRDPSLQCICVMADGFNIRTGARGPYKRMVCAMPQSTPANGGMMPEFSVMGARMEYRPQPGGEAPKHQISYAYERERGWRTVLARLYVARLITEAQIVKHFKPHAGRSSRLWQQQINSPITLGGSSGNQR